MLRELYIRNYGIFAEERIEFAPGLTIVTGETGAGKSLVVGAIALILGSRASKQDIRSGCDDATIEAVFDGVKDKDLLDSLREAGIETDGERLTIRRLIQLEGRGRNFVNDCSVTLATLTDIGQHLLDLSGQHAHQVLLEESTHLEILDRFASRQAAFVPILQRYRESYRELKRLIDKRRKLKHAAANRAERMDFLTFRICELEKLELLEGEDVELKSTLDRMQHSTKIYEAMSRFMQLNSDSDESILDKLGAAQRELEFASRFDESLQSSVEDAQNATSILNDLASSIRNYVDSLSFDPAERDKLEARWLSLAEVRRKYTTVNEALESLEEMRGELTALTDVDEDLSQLTQEIEKAATQARTHGLELRQARDAAAKRLQKDVGVELVALGMKGATLRIQQSPFAEEGQDGIDVGEGHMATASGLFHTVFYFSANTGEPVKPIHRVASGGELSRVMLALKLVLTEGENRTFIFDEIDTGVGGRQAEMIGQKLKRLAHDDKHTHCQRQAFCVTHLAPIAAFADHHFRVEKGLQGKRTVAQVRALNSATRRDELARMLAGATITGKTVAHAEEMLRNAQVTVS